MSKKSSQDNTLEDKNILKRFRAMAIGHPITCVFSGITVILLGLIVDHFNKNDQTGLFVLSHGLIILGEVIAVTFFLHLFVEEQQYEQHSQMLSKFSDASTQILEKQAISLKNELENLINDFKENAELIIADINENLFEAILKDKLPHQIVKPLLDSNFFIAEILRKKLVLAFDIRYVSGEEIHLTQRTEFDLEYVFGAKTEYSYDMPISLSNVPGAKYILQEVGYRRYEPGNTNWTKYKIGEGINRIGDDYTLGNPIEIQKNEKIEVFQQIDVLYRINDDIGIFDNYCSFNHTIGMRIDVINLPADCDFKLYPTFVSNKFRNPSITGTKISYKHIEFLVAGQGIGFSFSKKK